MVDEDRDRVSPGQVYMQLFVRRGWSPGKRYGIGSLIFERETSNSQTSYTCRALKRLFRLRICGTKVILFTPAPLSHIVGDAAPAYACPGDWKPRRAARIGQEPRSIVVRIPKVASPLHSHLKLDFGALSPARDITSLVAQFIGLRPRMWTTNHQIPSQETPAYSRNLPGNFIECIRNFTEGLENLCIQ
jgi:hypothetical protein